MNKKVYRWQPELTTSVIYWSCIFIILFISLILYFESIVSYFIIIITLLFFFLFFHFGYNRYFMLTDTELIIHRSFFFKNMQLSFDTIEQIKIGDKCIEITSSKFKNKNQVFLMTSKNKSLLLNELKTRPALLSKIVEDHHLKPGND